MKKTNKLWLALLLTVLVAALLAVGFTAAAEEPTIVEQGYCGNNGGTNVVWTLYSDDRVIVSGSGAMECYDGMPGGQSRAPFMGKASTVIVEEGVTYFGAEALHGDTVLQHLYIPSSMFMIDFLAFAGCPNLKTVTFAENDLLNIQMEAFGGCDNLTDVFYGGSEESWDQMLRCETGVGVSLGSNASLLDATFHYNVVDWGYCGGEGDGTNLMWMLDTADTLIFSGTGAMAEYGGNWSFPFHRYFYIAKQLVFDERMTSIGRFSFCGFTEITELNIPEGIKQLGINTFLNCTKLERVVLPEELTEIPYGLFNGCENLTDITIPDTVQIIDRYAFKNCKSLAQINLPDTITKIDDEAFCDCDSLSDIVLPAHITEIGENAFSGCKNLTEVTIPGSVKTIGSYAFAFCSSLTKAVLEQGVPYTAAGMFYKTALTDLYLPASITKIGDVLVTGMSYKFGPAASQSIGARFIQPGDLNIRFGGDEAAWGQIPIDNGPESYSNDFLIDSTVQCNYHEYMERRLNEMEPTCTATGSYVNEITCRYCDFESCETFTIDPINHRNAYDAPAVEATETAHGHTAGLYCPDCETWLSGEVVHNALGAQTVIRPATEEEEGLIDIVCTVCGETVRYTAEKLPHTEPQPSGTGDTGNGFWMRIQSAFRGFIDWFLRLFKWFK